MSVDDSPSKQIADLQKRLVELDQERADVRAALEQLQRQVAASEAQTATSLAADAVASPPVLSNIDKIALFRSLFRGRDDVFPRRWENSKTAKAGYAPACSNEWVRGICEKPRIKCSNCPNQAFVPVGDEVVRSHLQGRDVSNPKPTDPFVAGVYPLLMDETCWFLAASWPPISTKPLGSVMRWRSWQPAGREVCPQRLSAPGRAMAVTSGSSSRNPCRHPRRVSSVPIW